MPDGSLRVAYSGSFEGCSWTVVHWFLTVGPLSVSPTEYDALLGHLRDAFATAFIDPVEVSQNVVFTTVAAVYRFGDGSGQLRRVKIVDQIGPTAGAFESAQVAYLIDWQTTDPRRGGKPRSYICGVVDAAMQDGAILTAAAQAHLSTAADGYVSAVNSLASAPFSPIEFVDMSFVNAKDYRAAAHAFPIITGNASNAVGTQRRRVGRRRISI